MGLDLVRATEGMPAGTQLQPMLAKAEHSRNICLMLPRAREEFKRVVPQRALGAAFCNQCAVLPAIVGAVLYEVVGSDVD